MIRMSRPSTPEDEQPDATVFWRWVWASVRPVLGYLFIAVGAVLLLTAYLGVSREVLVAKQIPYLVSGGLFGVAAVTLGSRLLLIEDLRRDGGRLDRLERTVTELHAVLLTRPDAPSSSQALRASSNGAPDRLLALDGGDSFHRQDCPLVEGKKKTHALTAKAAQSEGLQACPMCRPMVVGV